MQSALAESLSVSNIIKNDSSLSTYFAEQFASLTPMKMVIALLFGLAVGMLIAFVYKKCYRGVLYSPTFSLTLIMLTLITTPVVMCIKSDIALSMGMVGALSIVRFRTAVKDPMDTAYMFWALTMGILLGAELYVIAVVVVLGIAVILFGLTFMKFRNPNAYLLVLHYDDDAEHDILSLLRRTVKQHRLRSKTVTRAGAEMTIEVRLGDKQDLVAAMLSIEGVHDATLVACQSEAGASGASKKCLSPLCRKNKFGQPEVVRICKELILLCKINNPPHRQSRRIRTQVRGAAAPPTPPRRWTVWRARKARPR